MKYIRVILAIEDGEVDGLAAHLKDETGLDSAWIACDYASAAEVSELYNTREEATTNERG